MKMYKDKGVAKHIYGVYRAINDEFIMQGTADEVAKYLGRTEDAVFKQSLIGVKGNMRVNIPDIQR